MGLPVCQIFINNKEHEVLKRDIWSDRFVQASMLQKGKRVPIRIRYRGGHTREYPKKSYQIRTSRETYHFNAEYDDPSMMRNALSFRFFDSINVPSPSARHCVLYINNKNAGVYLQIEAVKTPFFSRRGIPVRSIIYAVNDHADFTDKSLSGKSLFSGYSLIKGGQQDRVKLSEFIRSIHAYEGADLQHYLQRKLDIDNYLRWLSGAVLTGNYDGFKQNYTLFEHYTQKVYRIIPWDYEGTWGRNCYGKRVDSNLVKIHGYNKLTEKVLSYRVYRQQYKRILTDLLNTEFTLRHQLQAVYRMYNNIAEDIYKDPNQKWSHKVFDGEPNTIRDYIENRRQNIAEQLRSLDFL